jgi:hypothetical protein
MRPPPLLSDRVTRAMSLLALASYSLFLASCGGSGSGAATAPPPAGTYTAKSGVAQKGPLIKGSSVTAQELDAKLSPTGKQYSYQITSDLGTFSPTSTFGSQYIGVNTTGYYFDEVQNAVSGGTVTLNGYSDLSAVSVLNVNLLTTLAYQRIQNLVSKSGMTFAAAQTRAEDEVLAALKIQAGSSYGAFNTLDITHTTDGDKILVAISSLFVNGNSSGNLSALIANFQSDIGDNGVITSTATTATLLASAKTVNPGAVATNLTAKYAAAGLTFTAADISNWIDQDGDGVVGKFKFKIPDASQSSIFTFPSFVTDPSAGSSISISAGQLSVNGTPTAGAVKIKAGDVVAVSPPTGVFPNGVLTAYLLSGPIRVARVSFVSGLASIAVTPASTNLPVGLSYQFTATGTFTDASTADLTSTAQWSSSAPAIATVNATGGSALAVAPGQTTITATSGAISGSATLNVAAATLLSIAVTPNPFSTGVGIARSMMAIGTYSDGSTPNLTTTATWTTLDPTVATVTGGMVNGVSQGSTTVAATSAAISGSASLSVTTNTWSSGGNMQRGREGNSATLLPSGKVLVAGGYLPGLNGPGSTAEIYDPASNTWSYVASMAHPRAVQTATLLPNGRVLIAGGVDSGPAPLASAEIYDPIANSWSTAGSMNCGRAGYTATLLPSGKVLVAGGILGNQLQVCATGTTTAELYDPTTNIWSVVANTLAARYGHTATLLPNGKVLLAGGTHYFTGTSTTIPSAEIYDPSANAWSATGSMSVQREFHTEAVLANGTVLVTGGTTDGANALSSTESYNPVANSWSTAASMSTARLFHTATTLTNGTCVFRS